MKQKARHLRLMREKIAALPEAQRAEPQARYEAKAREVLLWEIAEYDERCNKYPTDKELRYEHGKRCLEAGSGGGAVTDMAMIDKAVDSLQLAVQNAKIKVKALDLQGTAFLLKGWFEEAVDAFKEAIEAYPGSNDDLSKRLHYNLGTAYEGLYSTNEGKKAADALEEALKEFRLVAGWQMTYKDVRDRIQKIRNAKAKAAAGS
jgi:tetratricopeptide (TPR) repeat protein